jgi:hypothetical protein
MISSQASNDSSILASSETPKLDSYERVISLGHNCIVRNQLNLFFKSFEDEGKRILRGGQLFDWLMIHDLKLMTDCINRKFVDIFDKVDLSIEDAPWCKDYKTVRNHKYKMTWNHLYDHENVALYPSKVSEGTPLLDEEIFSQTYTAKREKIQCLSEKFKDAKNQKTLYILAYTGADTTVEASFDEVKNLRDSLINIRDGDMNFTLLYVPLLKRFEGTENIIVEESPYTGEHWWWGNSENWTRILSDFLYNY